MKPEPLILASNSPRRAELLRQLGLAFEIVPSDVEEFAGDQLSPSELCQLNAHRKARAVAAKFPAALVLGADTLVFLGREIFGKPGSVQEACRMLLRLQGRTHHVVTGVSLIHGRRQDDRLFAVSTEVRFRKLGRSQVEHYVEQVHTLDKAGAYAVQEHGEWIIEEIAGSFTNIVGLPLERVETELETWRAAT